MPQTNTDSFSSLFLNKQIVILSNLNIITFVLVLGHFFPTQIYKMDYV